MMMNTIRILMVPNVAFFLCWLFATCKNSGEGRNSLASAWIDALNQHDTTAIARMYEDNATIESPNWEGVKTGSAEIRSIYRRYFSSTPDLRLKITHLINTDTCLLIEYDSWGTLENPEKPTPDYMRGRKYPLHNCTRMNLVNGKITRQITYFDQVSFLRQMGFFE